MCLLKQISRVFIKRGMPLNLIFFVTSKCNAKCRHCFYWQKINTIKDELSLLEIEKVAKSAPDLLTVTLTGGEPFLRDNLVEVASIFSRFTKVANLQIPTNGILTDRIFRTTKNILEVCRKDIRVAVGISIDNLGEKHNQIRQVDGCFEKAVKTIKKLKELEKEFSNFRLGNIVTITKDNQEEVGEIVDFLEKDLGVENVGVNIIRSEVRDMSLKELDIKHYDNIMFKLRNDFLEKTYKKNPSWIERILSSRQYYGSRILSRIYSEKKYITPCYAGNLLAILKENGDVYPCEMLSNKMGNLKDFDFNLKKLWFSKKSETVRKKIRKSKCFCTFECAMTSNTLFNPRHLFHILIGFFRRKPLS
ncbi:radical SAM protein [Patescibacteria group bacterium]|nr:radical SAM protein [Patescibacteria group bacterium]